MGQGAEMKPIRWTLGKDLTTIQVRKDTPQYRELIEELRATGERLRNKVKENMHLMPPSSRIQQILG